MRQQTNWEYDDFMDEEGIELREKIRRHCQASMPVRKSLSAARRRHQTTASRLASRRVSRCHGGIHLRRLRKVL
jgi:hypothetical protein